jgi:hypothetical protein
MAKTPEQMNAERRAAKAKQKRGSTKQATERFSLSQAIKERKMRQRNLEINQWMNQKTDDAIQAARKVGSHVVRSTDLKLIDCIQRRVKQESDLSCRTVDGGIVIAKKR